MQKDFAMGKGGGKGGAQQRCTFLSGRQPEEKREQGPSQKLREPKT